MNDVYVKKSNGQMQLFSPEKLKKSLEFTGADKAEVADIVNQITERITDGSSTRRIYKHAFNELRKISRPKAAFYGTKRALMALGPDGYLFERYISRVFAYLGYTTQVGVWLEGKCIGHEIDVVAKGPEKNILIECKFHNTRDRKNDIKTALYIKARADDIMNNPECGHFDEFWLVSNTFFSDDAIRYATCAGLHLWGANFPPQNTLQDIIRDHNLHPITCLSSLKKHEQTMLLDSEILLTKELVDNQQLLRDIGMESIQINRVMNEIKKINRIKAPKK